MPSDVTFYPKATEHVCLTCQWWDADVPDRSHSLAPQRCLRHPPVLKTELSDTDPFHGYWPETSASDRCGEYRPSIPARTGSTGTK